MIRRTIHPETRILSSREGTVEYVASDETVDSYREIIRADGWRFDDFERNAPFVDSHNYESIEHVLGRVIDFRVQGRRLVETVKWAIDVPENNLARKGFAMTEGGYLRAVSVGFMPVRTVTPWDSDPKPFKAALRDLGIDQSADIRAVYLEQQQKELSACVLGANPNAVARAYRAGILNDADLDLFSDYLMKGVTVDAAQGPAAATSTRQRARDAFLRRFTRVIHKL